MKHVVPISHPRLTVARADAGLSNFQSFKAYLVTTADQIARVVIVTKYGETLPS